MPELHTGLRTGFCGSLTTFASWEYTLVLALIGGTAPPVLLTSIIYSLPVTNMT